MTETYINFNNLSGKEREGGRVITKADIELEDLIPDEFMPHISVLKVYLRGNTDEIHRIYENFIQYQPDKAKESR